MNEERLKNEIKKVREAYAELQLSLKKCNDESSKAMDENKTLRDENKVLKGKLNGLELKINESQQKNLALLESKRKLNEEMNTIKQDTSGLDNLKAEVLTLEEQVIQLRLDLENAKTLNIQYGQENTVLNECLVNANDQIEDKIKEISRLEQKVQVEANEIDALKQNVTTLTEELQDNQQNRNAMLEALQKNRTLTAENNSLKKELINVLKLNDELQSQAYKNDQQIQDLQAKWEKATNTINELEAQELENSTKIHGLITELKEMEANLAEVNENRDELSLNNKCLEDRLAALKFEFKNLDQSYRTACEQLLNALKEKMQLEKELRAVTTAEQRGDTVEDLKFTLLTCMIATRKALDKLKKLPEDFVNGDVRNVAHEN